MLQNDELEATIELLTDAFHVSVKAYSEKLHRYPVHIVQTKNESLMRRLKDMIDPLFNAYCEKIEKKSIRIFEHDLNSTKNLPLTTALVNSSIDRAATFYRTSLQRKIYGFDSLLTTV